MPNPTLDQIITEAEEWFKETMHNSVVSREVAVYNHVRSAFEDLKGRLSDLFGAKPASAPQPAVQEEPAAAEDASASKTKPAT